MTEYTSWSIIRDETFTLTNEDPEVEPSAGNLVVPTDITITQSNPDSTMYYTTDGSDPTVASGTTYSGAINTFRDITDFKVIANETGWTDSNIVSNPYTWDYFTSILFQSDTYDGDRTLTDLSYNQHATNQAYNSTSVTKWGTTAFYILPYYHYYMSCPHNDDIEFGSGDFTIEGWFWTGSYAYAGTEFWKGHFVFGGSYGAVSWFFSIRGSSGTTVTVQFKYCTTGNTLNKTAFNGVIYQPDGVTKIDCNEWFYLSISRISDKMYLHVNGALQAGLPYDCGTDTIKANASEFGQSKYGPREAQGVYVDDFRIVKGKGLYSADYTTPTAPHEPDDRLDY